MTRCCGGDRTDDYQLAYDALGRCVKRTLNDVTTLYVYDGEKPIVEYNAITGGIAASNVYGKAIDEILLRTDNSVGQTYYYQQDHEGSVTHVTNASGAVVESYRYDAFGAPTIKNESGVVIASSAINNRFLFTGREYAAKFGVYEYRARAYHPGLGRFMSEDPKGFDAGDYNLFRYCKNDPLDLTDPMGLLSDAENLPPSVTLQINRAINALLNGASPKAILDAQPFIGDTTGKWAVEQGKQATQDYKNRNAGEAVRHEAFQAELARKHGAKAAEAIGNAHERGETDRADSSRDQFNDKLGRQNAPGSTGRKDSLERAKRDWETGRAAKDKQDPRLDEKKEPPPDAKSIEPSKPEADKMEGIHSTPGLSRVKAI